MNQTKTSMIYELTGPRVLEFKKERIDLSSLGSDYLFAKTIFSAISTGTELAAWTGKPPLRPSTQYPRLLGYGNVARVEMIGDNINDLDVGDFILTQQSHRDSFYCNKREVLIHAKNINQFDQKLMVIAYLYLLGYLALIDSKYCPGMDVSIVGLGALGFSSASLVSVYGGAVKIYSDRVNASQFSKLIPFSECLKKSNNEITSQLDKVLNDADIVINTSDSWDDYELSLKLVRPGGCVALIGFPGRGDAIPTFNPLDSKYLYDKSITIRQIGHVSDLDIPPVDLRFTLKRNIAHIFSLLQTRRVDPTPLLSSLYPFNNLKDAYEMLEKRNTFNLSCILDWTC